MKEKVKKALKIAVFILTGVILFWLVYRNQPVEDIKKSLLQADWRWLLVSIFLGLLSHISRSLRWSLLIEPMGYKPRKLTLFYSVMIMYLTNYAIPRSGEVVRCGFVNRYEKVPFSGLLGTVVTERAIDFLMLFLLTLIVAFTQLGVVIDFFNNNPSAKATIEKLQEATVFFIIFFAVSIIFIFVLYKKREKLRQSKIYLKFKKIIDDFWTGLKSVKHIDRKFEFIAHTIFIWTMYFVMIYVVFKAFPFTSDLGVLAGLTVFVMSSFGMVFPSPGGIGSWHFMAIETLFIYGVDKTQGSAFAFAAHESQMLMLLVVGFFSLIAISFIKVKDSKTNNIKSKV